MDPSPVLIAAIVIDRLRARHRAHQIRKLPRRQATSIATMSQRNLRLVRLRGRDRTHDNRPNSLRPGRLTPIARTQNNAAVRRVELGSAVETSSTRDRA